MRSLGIVVALALWAGACGSAVAQMREPGAGPVAEHCQNDIEALCPQMTHGGGKRGQIRPCLEAKIAQVTPACRTALETTGPRRRR